MSAGMTSAERLAAQLTSHHADRVELTGDGRPVAALVGRRPGRSAPVAVLVPGYTGSKEDFAPLVDPIVAAGIEVVAIDLPGQQHSPGSGDESAYSPAALGAVVADLVDELAAAGRPVLLLGHSFGGLVCRRAVLAGAPVTGLTLMGSGPAALPPGQRRTLLDLGEPVLRGHGVAGAADLLETMRAGDPAWLALPEPLRVFLNARFRATDQAGLLGMGSGLRTEPDLVAELADTLRREGCRSLVVCGETDDAWPVATQRDMAARLGADFVTVAGAAHSPNVENPAGLLAALLPTWHGWLAQGLSKAS